MDFLEHLIDAPVANLLMVSGLIFLGIAAIGKIMGKIEPDRTGRILCGLLGLALFLGGTYTHVRQDSLRAPDGRKMDEQKVQTSDKDKDARPSVTEREKSGHVRKDSAHLPQGKVNEQKAQTFNSGKQSGPSITEGENGKKSQPSLAKTPPTSSNDTPPMRAGSAGLAQKFGLVFTDGNPLPLALQKWPLNQTRYSQVRFSWNFPRSAATFEERRIHIPDIGHRLFTSVDYLFDRTQPDPFLVRVQLQFRDKDAADYVRSQAIEHLGAPVTGENVTWQNSAGGRSQINQQLYMLDTSRLLPQSPAPPPQARPVITPVAVGATDAVKLLSVTPRPGTHLGRGQPLAFAIQLVYNLASADAAILSLSTAQFSASMAGCNGRGELVDAIEVPIQKGKHQIQLSMTWSGDTGRASRGRIYGQGYLSFMPMFWANNAGSRGQRLKLFPVSSDHCYPFGS